LNILENIGILISNKKGGGSFQHAMSIIYSLIKYSHKYNYKIITNNSENLNRSVCAISRNIDYIFLSNKKSSLKNKIKLACNLAIKNNFFDVQNNEIISQIKNHQVKLLITPFASLMCYKNKIPYIVSILDIMHKYYPSFPEYPLKERIMRNIVYENASKHSLFAVVDSKQGADDLNSFYKIPKEKIRVIPYIPPPYIYKYKNMTIDTASNILAKYSLPNKFFFYPAQFWYHKNHIRLFKALKLINEKNQEKIYLVLVGSQKESFANIMNFIKKNNLSHQIIYLGYVSDKEIVALYKKAVAFVFPSLLGPTNIPPLEAMLLGTPVICSKLFSMPDQIGNAGLFFNPFEVKDIADKIYKIWMDKDLRSDLIRKGYKKIKDITLERYAKQWEDVIDEALGKIK
jgi:glycosyltransferase involved in cell wall biosynthesis